MAIETGYINRPYPGEVISGDAGRCWVSPHRCVLALADGLGHGPGANYAAVMAMACIENSLEQDCMTMFLSCNEKLVNTRGCVLSIAIIDLHTNWMTLGTVGNIHNVLLARDREVKFGASRGFVGAGPLLLTPIQTSLMLGDYLLMSSDGISEEAKISRDLLSAESSAQQLAEAVLARWGGVNDDASVLVYRHNND